MCSETSAAMLFNALNVRNPDGSSVSPTDFLRSCTHLHSVSPAPENIGFENMQDCLNAYSTPENLFFCDFAHFKSVNALKAQLQKFKLPVLIRIKPNGNLHTVPAVGYDATHIYYHETDPRGGAFDHKSDRELDRLWQATGRHAIVCTKKNVGNESSPPL